MTPHDRDWLVLDGASGARAWAMARGGTVFALDAGRDYWRVVGPDGQDDFSGLKSLDAVRLRADLERRDFTLNAMILQPDGRLFDPLGGRRDLRARVLNLANPSSLTEDPLRVFRAARFAAQGYRLSPDTARAARRVAGELLAGTRKLPAAERMRDELTRILEGPLPLAGLRALNDVHALDVILPELVAGRGVAQGKLHHLDVLGHSLEAEARLATLFPEASLAARLAALLHDVGKPMTAQWQAAQKRPAFPGHDGVGAELTISTLRRLRYPEAVVRQAGAIVAAHMAPLPEGDRAARRFVFKHRALLPDLLQVMIADREASRGPASSEVGRDRYRAAIDRVLVAMREPATPRPLLDGRDVMDALGLQPGPKVGEATAFLAEAQALGDASSPEEARLLLTAWWAARNGNRL